MNKLPANQTREWKPSLQAQNARDADFEWTAGRAFTLLSHYYREDDNAALTAEISADWAEVLEGLPREAIHRACIKYQRDEPRKKPTPGAIYALAREFIPRAAPAPQTAYHDEPKAERCDPEIAQMICEQAGYTPKRFGGSTDEL